MNQIFNPAAGGANNIRSTPKPDVPSREHKTIGQIIASTFSTSIPSLFQNESPHGVVARRLAAIGFGLLCLAVVIHMNWGINGLLVGFSITALLAWRLPWANVQAESWSQVLNR
ncbi:MAG: hypothetical protein HQL67_11765 [Magnetococcales bacterium]|nr:hypothetical protein [Magnetococcales bacterium]